MDFNKFLSEFEKMQPSVELLFNSKFDKSANAKARALWVTKVVNSIKANPELLRCKPESLFGSIMFFADLNLYFNTPEGFGYVVSINSHAMPIIGYKGLIEVAYRNPALKSIRMATVYPNDVFEYQMGTSEFIKHIPSLKKLEGEKPIAAYAVASIEGLNPFFTVIVESDMQRISNGSLTWNHFSKTKSKTVTSLDINHVMQAKATIKQLFKTLPKGGNEKLLEAMDVDNKLDFDKTAHIGVQNGKYKVFFNSKFGSITDKPAPEITVSKSEKKINEEKNNS